MYCIDIHSIASYSIFTVSVFVSLFFPFAVLSVDIFLFDVFQLFLGHFYLSIFSFSTFSVNSTTTPNHFNNSYDLEWNMDEGDADDYDYSIDEDNDDDDNDDEEEDNDNDKAVLNELVNFDDDDESDATSIREDFKGINIRDDIGIEDIKTYFKIKINDTVKYLHKQSACWLLTDKNKHISAYRLCRVIETSRSNI